MWRISGQCGQHPEAHFAERCQEPQHHPTEVHRCHGECEFDTVECNHGHQRDSTMCVLKTRRKGSQVCQFHPCSLSCSAGHSHRANSASYVGEALGRRCRPGIRTLTDARMLRDRPRMGRQFPKRNSAPACYTCWLPPLADAIVRNHLGHGILSGIACATSDGGGRAVLAHDHGHFPLVFILARTE